MKGLFNPSHTMNLWVKLQDPILKLTMTDPFTPILCPLAVLMFILLSEILCSKSSADAVSYLMQLTCAPVSNMEGNTKLLTFILKIIPFILPCWMNTTSFSFVSTLWKLSGSYPFASQADEFPNFSVFSFLPSILPAFIIRSLMIPNASTKFPSVISLTSVSTLPCFCNSSLLSFIAKSNCLKKESLNFAQTKCEDSCNSVIFESFSLCSQFLPGLFS